MLWFRLVYMAVQAIVIIGYIYCQNWGYLYLLCAILLLSLHLCMVHEEIF